MGTVSLVLKQCVTGAQSQCPERPKLRMSRFGVRRGSAIETAAVERMGTLVVPQTHLSQVRSEAACMSVEGRVGEARGDRCPRTSGRQHGSEEDHETSVSPVH